MTDHDMQQVQVPLPDFVRQIVRETAREVIDQHVKSCAHAESMASRIKKLEDANDKQSNKWWEFVKLILAAVAGGIVSKIKVT